MNAHQTARYWHQLPSGKIQCDLCPRGCKLVEGKRGFCYVRKAEGGQLVLTSWGKSNPPQMDPIEKKPLNHFYPGSRVLSFGTAGCNLGCKFCQNWQLSKNENWQDYLEHGSPETLARYARSLGAKSLAMTYNDPVPYTEYGHEIGRACREEGVKVVVVSAGYINPEPRVEFFEFVDAANIDLKGFDEAFYRKLTKGHLQPVLDTLTYIRNFTKVWLELTNLIIPGWNDDPKMIADMCRWIVEELGADTPLHLSAFHPDYQMTDVPPTPKTTLRQAWEIAKEAGLNFVYTGNVHDLRGDETDCPHCGKAVIIRDWYQLKETHLEGGNCGYCKKPIPGVFV